LRDDICRKEDKFVAEHLIGSEKDQSLVSFLLLNTSPVVVKQPSRC